VADDRFRISVGLVDLRESPITACQFGIKRNPNSVYVPKAIRTLHTLNSSSKRNILSWSSIFSSLYPVFPHSSILYIPSSCHGSHMSYTMDVRATHALSLPAPASRACSLSRTWWGHRYSGCPADRYIWRTRGLSGTVVRP
jgi:hypothetical protein